MGDVLLVEDDACAGIEPRLPKNEPSARRIADFLDFTVDRNPYKRGRYTPLLTHVDTSGSLVAHYRG